MAALANGGCGGGARGEARSPISAWKRHRRRRYRPGSRRDDCARIRRMAGGVARAGRGADAAGARGPRAPGRDPERRRPRPVPARALHRGGRVVRDAIADAGLADARLLDMPDGHPAVFGHAPGPEGAPTVLLYCHYDVQPPLGEDAWETPALRAGRARRPLVRPRRRRLQGQRRRAPDRAARARRRVPGAASSSSPRAPRSRPRAGSRSSCPTRRRPARAPTRS